MCCKYKKRQDKDLILIYTRTRAILNSFSVLKTFGQYICMNMKRAPLSVEQSTKKRERENI